MEKDNNFSVRPKSNGRNEPNRVRFALVLMCDPEETDKIIDLIDTHTKAFVVFRKIARWPLWISDDPPHAPRGETA